MYALCRTLATAASASLLQRSEGERVYAVEGKETAAWQTELGKLTRGNMH